MSDYLDDNTEASNPGGVSLHKRKLKLFKQELGFFDRIQQRFLSPNALLKEHLMLGDSRAAVVVSTSWGLIIAAYTDELDCVALLEFPEKYIKLYNLSVGSHLLTINTYVEGNFHVPDLIRGPKAYDDYINFHPIIAEFLSADMRKINMRKSEISAHEWSRTKKLGEQAIQRKLPTRNGSPYKSMGSIRWYP